jgi:hypothetical protein
MSEHGQQPFTVGGAMKLAAAAASARTEAEATSLFAPSGPASAGTASPPTGSGRGATILVAASNTSRAGQAAADYVCTGTSATGGDEEAINAALIVAQGDQGDQGGRVVLLEGTYWCTNPIICDSDYTVLEGQGNGTVIAVPTSVTSPTGYARVIFGNTRTLTQSSLRHFRVQPAAAGGIDLIAGGEGHGIAFRSNGGRLDDITIQSCAGDGWKIGGCANTSYQVTVSTNITAEGTARTQQTWDVSAVPTNTYPDGGAMLAKVVPSSYSGTPGNDDSIETVVVIAASTDPGTVTVLRGWGGTPMNALGADALLIPIDPIYEVGGTMLHAICPGGNGITVEYSAQNCEFIRCVAAGGKELSPPRGADGFSAAGNIIKFVVCHAYYQPNDGLNVNATGITAGTIQVIGGEYEANGGWGINLTDAYYAQIRDTVHYGNCTGDITVSGGERNSIQGIRSAYTSGNSAFQHVVISGSPRARVSNGIFELGESPAIAVSGYSPMTVVQGNTIYGLDPSQSGAYSILLSGCQFTDVTGNIVDRFICEDNTGGDWNRIWGNRVLPTNSEVGHALAGVTTNGAHTVAYENLGQSDKIVIPSSTSSFSAALRKTYLVTADSGGTTVTLPGASIPAGILACSSYGATLSSVTSLALVSVFAPAAGGMVMVPLSGGGYSVLTYTGVNYTANTLIGCYDGSGTAASAADNVYILPPDGEEFSIAQINDSDTVTLLAPPGSLINGASSFTLTPQRAYRVMLLSGNWSAY